MAGSEELYGEGHPATYEVDDPENPLYDSESKWYDAKASEDFKKGIGAVAAYRSRLDDQKYIIDIEGSEEINGPNREPPRGRIDLRNLGTPSLEEYRRDS